VIKTVFKKIEVDIIQNMAEDIRYSGSTITCVLMFGKRLYIANLGDSRTILIREGRKKNVPYNENCEQI